MDGAPPSPRLQFQLACTQRKSELQSAERTKFDRSQREGNRCSYSPIASKRHLPRACQSSWSIAYDQAVMSPRQSGQTRREAQTEAVDKLAAQLNPSSQRQFLGSNVDLPSCNCRPRSNVSTPVCKHLIREKDHSFGKFANCVFTNLPGIS